MNKKFVTIFFAGLLLLTLFVSSPSWFGVCFPSERTGNCLAPYGYEGAIFLPIVSAFLLISLVTLAFRDSVFRALRKFSFWYGVISLAIIGFFIYQNEYFGGGFSPFSLLSDPVPVSWLLSIVYALVSLVIIIRVAMKK